MGLLPGDEQWNVHKWPVESVLDTVDCSSAPTVSFDTKGQSRSRQVMDEQDKRRITNPQVLPGQWHLTDSGIEYSGKFPLVAQLFLLYFN
jgi:hypothetical protein